MCKKIKITKKQKNVLKFIKRSMKRRGIPPTVREIMHYFRFKSSRAAQHYISILIKKKLLKPRRLNGLKRRVARGLKLRKTYTFV